MKRYDTVLFDWDGNLAMTLGVWLDAFREVFSNHGYHLSDQEIVAKFGGFVDKMAATGMSRSEANQVYDDAVSRVTDQMPKVGLYPDAYDTLRQLHAQGKRIALVTSSRREQVEPAVQRHGLDALFGATIYADDVVRCKPDPEPLLKALALLGSRADGALMVGDSMSDILAARNAGVRSALFYPSEHRHYYVRSELETYRPDYTINTFSQLLPIVL